MNRYWEIMMRPYLLPEQDKDFVTTGIWKSYNKGETWFYEVEGLRVKQVTTIAAHPYDSSLVMHKDWQL